ncbi:hypothetical protein ACN28S_28035 [Cystobacter fuscus]
MMVAGCAAGCHGVSGIGPKGFRLDVYEGDGGVLGARDMAARIKARAVIERNMPPPGSTEFTEEQRILLDRWVTGARPCVGTRGRPTAAPRMEVPATVAPSACPPPLLAVWAVFLHWIHW